MPKDILIRQLAPPLLKDYLSFFNEDAFADNPHWAAYYCYFYHAPHEQRDFSTRSGPENRAAVIELIQAGFAVYREFDDLIVVRKPIGGGKQAR